MVRFLDPEIVEMVDRSFMVFQEQEIEVSAWIREEGEVQSDDDDEEGEIQGDEDNSEEEIRDE